ncbi:MAG: hypothetical protein AB7I59_05445 [Geminicoccaceae bacterium]
MTEAASLDELKRELAELQRRREARQHEARRLGVGAANIGADFDILSEMQRGERAAEEARVPELEAAIAAIEADQPGSPERTADVWRQLEARAARRRQDDAP